MAVAEVWPAEKTETAEEVVLRLTNGLLCLAENVKDGEYGDAGNKAALEHGINRILVPHKPGRRLSDIFNEMLDMEKRDGR